MTKNLTPEEIAEMSEDCQCSCKELEQMTAQRDHWLEIAREKDVEIERLRSTLEQIAHYDGSGDRMMIIAQNALDGSTVEPKPQSVTILSGKPDPALLLMDIDKLECRQCHTPLKSVNLPEPRQSHTGVVLACSCVQKVNPVTSGPHALTGQTEPHRHTFAWAGHHSVSGNSIYRCRCGESHVL